MEINFLDSLSVFMVLFAVIDVIGTIPIILDLKNKGKSIEPAKTTSVAFLILISFLFLGNYILKLFAVDISSFAIAGSIVMFILALEMILGIELFKNDHPGGASIVPIAFPLIAGAGSFTTLLSLRAEYSILNIIIGLVANMLLVFMVLKLTDKVERFLGINGIYALRKVFGIILLAVAIKLFTSNTGIQLGKH